MDGYVRDNGRDQPMADMNRRNVLLGLGTAAAGSGVVFGSGALTSLNADRDVDIEIVDATDGLLGIELDTGDSEFFTDEGEEVFAIDDDGTLEVQAPDRDEPVNVGEDDSLTLTANPRDATDDDDIGVAIEAKDSEGEAVNDEDNVPVEFSGDENLVEEALDENADSEDAVVIEGSVSADFQVQIIPNEVGDEVETITFVAEETEGPPDIESQ